MRHYVLAAICVALLSPAAAQGQSALERLEQLLKKPPAQPVDFQPGYLGVVADDRDEKGRGVRVLKVGEGSPAALSGLAEQDLIVAIDSRAIRGMADMGRFLENTPVGGKLLMDVERGGRTIRLNVTLGTRPAPNQRLFQDFGRIDGAQPAEAEALPPAQPAQGAPRGVLLGVKTVPLTAEDQVRFRLPSALGARVTELTPGGPAERLGLRVDDIVVAVDSQVVNRPSDLTELVGAAGQGRTVELAWYRAGKFQQARVRLGVGPTNAVPPHEVQRPAAEATLPPPVQPVRPGDPIPPQPVQPGPQVGEGPILPGLPAERLPPERPLTDRQRIELLERMVFELNERLQQLEGELRRARKPE